MLSTSAIKSSGQASHYFSGQDNYYTKEEGLEQSEWYGKGAKAQQLEGQINEQVFEKLLNGVTPAGEPLGKMVDGQIKHRPGWDLTLSAPKSVSIMALVAGDKRLIDAHRQAVKTTLDHIERACAQARIRKDGDLSFERTNNITAALYHHDLSRAKDPQMHTHSVIMNMTQRADGKWRSMASSIGKYGEDAKNEVNGFIERVRHNNRFYSKLYETELAFQVKQLGYEIRTEGKTGIFEIAAIPKELNDTFSKRRLEIEAELEERGTSGGKAASFATLSTREKKEIVDRGEMLTLWEAEAKAHGIDLHEVKEASIQKAVLMLDSTQKTTESVNTNAIKVIQQASKQLAVFQTNFSLEQLVEYASKEAITRHIDVTSLLAAIDHETKVGGLIPIANELGKSTYMAKSTLQDENNLLSLLKDNLATKQLISPKVVEQILDQHSEIQKEAHSDLLQVFDKDRVVLVEGEENKNRLIEPTLRISQSARLRSAIISPTQVAGKQLVNEVKPQPQTFWEHVIAIFKDNTPKHYSPMQFINQADSGKLSEMKPELLIVDQAHLLSTHQKAKLVQWTHDNNAKLLLFGSQDKLLPYQVSTSLKQLSDKGIKTIAHVDSLTKNAVMEPEKLAGMFSQIKDKLHELAHIEDRQQAISSHFMRLPANEQKSTLITTASKLGVQIMNQQVHDGLVASCAIKQSIACETLTPVYIQEDKVKLASSYANNQIIRFNEDYRKLGVKRGDYLKIQQVRHPSNRIILEKPNGSRIVWRPDRLGSSKVEVFHAEVKEIGVGERLILTRGIKANGLVKGERCTIESLNGHHAKIRDQSGKLSTLDLTQPSNRHVDYGYAATLHSMTHEKPTTLLADLPAQTINTHQRRLNQLLSQSSNVHIYTNDIKKLENTLTRQSGNQFSANEIKEKSDATKAALHQVHTLIEGELAKLSRSASSWDIVEKAVSAVDYALHHLSERTTGFSHSDLMVAAMTYAMGEVTPTMLTDVARAMEKSNILIRGVATDQTIWTTAEAVKTERQIMALAEQDRGKMQPLAEASAVKAHFQGSSLRGEQVDAIASILSSTDRVLSIQGRAGTGKTTMMSSLDSALSIKNVVAESGYALRGIAPTNKAVKELTSRGIPSQTIDSFLAEIQQLKEKSQAVDFTKTIFVLDEASMVSNRKMLEVMQVAHDYGFARLIPTGDIHQNPAIESGKPHDLVQRSLGHVISLDQIQRQQNLVLREAALALYEGKTARSFALLSDRICEIKNADFSKEAITESYSKRVDAIVSDYFKFKALNESVQIIAPAHMDRRAINTAIRERMSEVGELISQSHSFKILTAKDMTRAERSKADNFEVGDVMKFTISQSKDIRSNDFFRVINIEPSHNLLTLAPYSGDAKEVLWQIPTSRKQLNHVVEVFKEEERNLSAGDKIVWMRTNKQSGVLSAEVSKVTAIQGCQVSILADDKREHTFDASLPSQMNWDHGYALTTYSTQGGTYNTVLGFFETSRKQLMNLKTFLVTITRPVNELKLYTDDKQKLQELVTNKRGDKLSSLEVIGQYPASKVAKTKIVKSGHENKETAEPNSPTQAKETKARYDRLKMDRIIDGVNKDAEKIAKHLLGSPKVNGGSFLKFGSNQGSLSVTIKGERQGWWNDFSEGKGGRSMLSFVQHQTGLPKQEAIEFCARWVGVGDVGLVQPSVKAIKADTNLSNKPSESTKAEEAKKVAFAKKLASQSEPAMGTVVERYLKEQRSIVMEKLPADVRYHAGVYSKLNGQTHPAMLVIARDHLGNIKAVQATYLDPVTGKKVDASTITVQKQSFGSLKGSTVTLGNSEKGAPTLIAEGMETGLSLKQALPNTAVKVTLSKSNFLNINPKSVGEKVVLCLDQDGKDLKADKTVFESAKRLSDANKQVALMVPSAASVVKQDYNDVLKQVGEAAIRRDFDSAIPYKSMYPDSQSVVVNGTSLDRKQVAVLANQHEKMIGAAIDLISANGKTRTPFSEKMIAELAKNSVTPNQKLDGMAYQSLVKDTQPTKVITPITREIEQNI